VLDTIIGYFILAIVAGMLLTAFVAFATGMFYIFKDSGIFGVLAGLAGLALMVMALWPPFVFLITFNISIGIGLSDTWSAFISIASVFIATGIGYCLLIESSDGRFKRKVSK